MSALICLPAAAKAIPAAELLGNMSGLTSLTGAADAADAAIVGTLGAAAASIDVSDDAPPPLNLLDVCGDVLGLIATHLISKQGPIAFDPEFVASATLSRAYVHLLTADIHVLVRLSMACKTLHNIANTWIPSTNLERFSLEVAIKRSQCHRITFQDARIELQDTVANKSRVAVIAALLRRHPSLICHVEAHAGSRAPSAVASGFSMQRLLKLGALLGAYGADPKQLRLRGWGSSVSSIAQWPVGPASRRCDIFFSFDEKTGLAPAAAVEVEADDLCLTTIPTRPEWYARACEKAAVSADAAGASTDSDTGTGGGSFKKPYKVLPVDKQFFDAIAQELMGNEKLKSLWHSLRGQPQCERLQIVNNCDAETRRLFEAVGGYAGDGRSTASSMTIAVMGMQGLNVNPPPPALPHGELEA